MLTFAVKETSRGMQVRQLVRQPKRLRDLARSALVSAISEYTTGRLAEANIRDRFGPSAFARYGLARRSAGYRRRQERDISLRGPAAFIGPRTINIARISGALRAVASAKTSAASLVSVSRALTSANPGRPHLRDLITVPGVGHRLVVSGGALTKVTITYPAARALNANPKYGDELRDLSLGGYRDWRAIVRRANAIFAAHVSEIGGGRRRSAA